MGTGAEHCTSFLPVFPQACGKGLKFSDNLRGMEVNPLTTSFPIKMKTVN